MDHLSNGIWRSRCRSLFLPEMCGETLGMWIWAINGWLQTPEESRITIRSEEFCCCCNAEMYIFTLVYVEVDSMTYKNSKYDRGLYCPGKTGSFVFLERWWRHRSWSFGKLCISWKSFWIPFRWYMTWRHLTKNWGAVLSWKMVKNDDSNYQLWLLHWWNSRQTSYSTFQTWIPHSVSFLSVKVHPSWVGQASWVLYCRTVPMRLYLDHMSKICFKKVHYNDHWDPWVCVDHSLKK